MGLKEGGFFCLSVFFFVSVVFYLHFFFGNSSIEKTFTQFVPPMATFVFFFFVLFVYHSSTTLSSQSLATKPSDFSLSLSFFF